MKKILILSAMMLLAGTAFGQTLQKETADNAAINKDMIIGTWKFLGAVDSLGNEIAYYSGEETYLTFLENGKMIQCGFRKTFPESVSNPMTKEDLLKIYNGLSVFIANYTFDGRTVHFTFTQNTYPENIGKTLDATLDTLYDDGRIVSRMGKNLRLRYKKVK